VWWNKLQIFGRIKGKDVAKYVFLPGIVPRTRELAGSGFKWLAQLMAVIYQSVRLLPANHPYLMPENAGKFGVRHVIAEAHSNLKYTRSNIDQIIIFFSLIAGFIILVMQFVLLIFTMIIRPVFAAGFFGTPGCTPPGAITPGGCTDIAFQLLDQVFGVPGMFNSTYAPLGPGFIPPINQAMQGLFQFYSWGILLIGLLVFIYYLFVVIGETAQYGTPFGRRFSKVWAPIRLVVALGLLVPMNYGYNSAQYITLMAAKMGSGLATNGWYTFNRTVVASQGDSAHHGPWDMPNQSYITKPQNPDLRQFYAFMTLAKACANAYNQEYSDKQIVIRPYLVKSSEILDSAGNPVGTAMAQALHAPSTLTAAMPSYEQALEFYGNKDVYIRFGHYDGGPNGAHRLETGGVYNYCGELKIPSNVTGPEPPPNSPLWGPWKFQEVYYLLVDYVFGAASNNALTTETDNFANRMTWIYLENKPNPCSVAVMGDRVCAENNRVSGDFQSMALSMLHAQAYSLMNGLYAAWVNAMSAATTYQIPNDLLQRGWGGAGIWYNKIAQWNGSLITTTINGPRITRMPDVMEQIREQHEISDEMVDAYFLYQPYLTDGDPVDLKDDGEIGIAKMLNAVYLYWRQTNYSAESDVTVQGNIIMDLLNSMLGIDGLFTMRDQKYVHPMAQLTGVGKSIIESAINNLMFALGLSALGGAAGQMTDPHLGAALGAMSRIFVGFTTMGLTVGFVLYYVLPFLPFIYFFFALGNWIKTIFEAMVGVPLWALAHLRIDGDGLPGDMATNGYFLIFEIFVRPILIVFGLIAGMVIFSSIVRVLNEIFGLVVENITGHNVDGTILAVEIGHKHSVVDEFFYTVLYAIIVYLIATSSFKLIDQIPGNILRWMGAGVQSFADQSQDPTAGLTQYAAIGGSQIGSQAVGAATQGASLAGQGVGLLGRRIFNTGNQVNLTGPGTKP
jgi:conjugal transfer/type IV secretion protein DotA/TraY